MIIINKNDYFLKRKPSLGYRTNIITEDSSKNQVSGDEFEQRVIDAINDKFKLDNPESTFKPAKKAPGGSKSTDVFCDFSGTGYANDAAFYIECKLTPATQLGSPRIHYIKGKWQPTETNKSPTTIMICDIMNGESQNSDLNSLISPTVNIFLKDLANTINAAKYLFGLTENLSKASKVISEALIDWYKPLESLKKNSALYQQIYDRLSTIPYGTKFSIYSGKTLMETDSSAVPLELLRWFLYEYRDRILGLPAPKVIFYEQLGSDKFTDFINSHYRYKGASYAQIGDNFFSFGKQDNPMKVKNLDKFSGVSGSIGVDIGIRSSGAVEIYTRAKGYSTGYQTSKFSLFSDSSSSDKRNPFDYTSGKSGPTTDIDQEKKIDDKLASDFSREDDIDYDYDLVDGELDDIDEEVTHTVDMLTEAGD